MTEIVTTASVNSFIAGWIEVTRNEAFCSRIQHAAQSRKSKPRTYDCEYQTLATSPCALTLLYLKFCAKHFFQYFFFLKLQTSGNLSFSHIFFLLTPGCVETFAWEVLQKLRVTILCILTIWPKKSYLQSISMVKTFCVSLFYGH